MKNKYILLILFIVVILGCAGCKENNEVDNEGFKIYYLNNDITKITPIEYELEDGSVNQKLDEVMKLIQTDPVSIDCKRAFKDDIEILDYHLENRQLLVTFNEAYLEMDAAREVLCRAAIVKTITQLDHIDYVVFYIGDAPLTDYKGNPVGVMTKDDFIENDNNQINSVQAATLTLYFSNKDGDKLVKEIQNVHYSSNISMEKLVVEQLIAGPRIEEGYQTISQNTKLLSISQKDGVCYVDFNEGFLESVEGVTEEVTIYSIVNSLSEIPNNNKIQISVNGDTDISINDKIRLDTPFERNLDMIQVRETKETDVELPAKEAAKEEVETDIEIPDE